MPTFKPAHEHPSSTCAELGTPDVRVDSAYLRLMVNRSVTNPSHNSCAHLKKNTPR